MVEAIAPDILLGLLFYGYATGTFSSRKIETRQPTSRSFRFIAGGLHPDTIPLPTFANLATRTQRPVCAYPSIRPRSWRATIGNISLDGTKIHADASKSKAVSYQRLLELESRLRTEVDELFALTEPPEPTELPTGLVIADEIAFRQERLANLAKARAVLEARAQERYAAEQAHLSHVRVSASKSSPDDRAPRGRPPTTVSATDKDQYNFTIRVSIMKQHTMLRSTLQCPSCGAADSLFYLANTLSTIQRSAEASRLGRHPVRAGKPTAEPLTMVLAPPTSLLWKRVT